MAKGLKAAEWVDKIKTRFPGAKGGGKDDTAQMNGKGAAQVCMSNCLDAFELF